jgi:membrane protein
MIAGPILFAVALELLASAEHSPAARWLDSFAHLAWTFRVLGQILPYGIVTLVFTLMYAFIPNTRVEFKAALIGGVTAGIIWALVGQAFTAFIVYSSQMMAVYTGFAIVLTTLIWVYLSWLILLIGAQLACYVQFPRYLRHGREAVALSGSAREQVGLSIMYLIGRDYRRGAPQWSAGGLAAELDIPDPALAPILACLQKTGLIVATGADLFLPGRDPEGIALAAVIDAMRTREGGQPALAGRPVAPTALVMIDIEAAMRQQLGNRSLKDLIAAV